MAAQLRKPTSTKQVQLSKNYAAGALAALHKAIAAGYKDVAHMKKDPDLDPIRNREDLKKPVAEMERKTPASKGKK